MDKLETIGRMEALPIRLVMQWITVAGMERARMVFVLANQALEAQTAQSKKRHSDLALA